MSEESVTAARVGVARDPFGPGHLGELTRIVPFEMVDAALAETGAQQRRVRRLPSRVVVYLLLAGSLFSEIGLGQVWSRLCAGLEGFGPSAPAPSALTAARARVGVAPFRALFELLRGAQTGPTARAGVFWRSRLVTALDGSILCCPDTAANLAVYRKGRGHGESGYPMVRVLSLLACGTRTVIDAVFGSDALGELGYLEALTRSVRAGMIVLADRNFDAARAVTTITATGADVLIRLKNTRRPHLETTLPDGSYLTRIGGVRVRVITARITVTTDRGARHEHYRLATTIVDPEVPATEIVELYHQRWEIETSFAEIKSTTLHGRVLRSRTPNGVAQEIYALLITYQVLRIAISDSTLHRPDIDPDRASFTVALHAARDQVVAAAGIITDTVVDLVGTIGRHVLAARLPPRRTRTGPRVTKRAMSKFAANTIHGRQHGPTRKARISIELEPILTTPAAA